MNVRRLLITGLVLSFSMIIVISSLAQYEPCVNCNPTNSEGSINRSDSGIFLPPGLLDPGRPSYPRSGFSDEPVRKMPHPNNSPTMQKQNGKSKTDDIDNWGNAMRFFKERKD
jgi:hypothetical protein